MRRVSYQQVQRWPDYDQAQAARVVSGFPSALADSLQAVWQQKRNDHDGTLRGPGDALVKANKWLWQKVERLESLRLSLSATDGDICANAAQMAAHCLSLTQPVPGLVYSTPAARAAMVRVCVSQGIEAPESHRSDGPAIARMTCAQWWRRRLRKAHAQAVEGAAIDLGHVNRARDLYVSEQSLQRRIQQNKRNAQALENTTLRNEEQQEFTLAELSAKGTANKAIRRGELMTRIAGFERIAKDMGHAGLFVTITCPSRMHKFTALANGVVRENKKYDGTLPDAAQAYLCAVWAKIRAKLARQKIKIYGFRIAEPNHDGTPHWHMLIFCAPGQQADIEKTMRDYALADSPDERGAAEHRFTSKTIDWQRGTAAGYMAKYVAKNIDGMHVGLDLEGKPAIETSQRVEAWAATWRIRQFQQIGGAPVGVWRELRRVKELAADAPEHLVMAWQAVNKLQVAEGRDKASAAWDKYVKAQGGVFVGRKRKIGLCTEEVEGAGRYGEALAPAIKGVQTVAVVYRRDGIIKARAYYENYVAVSLRHIWEVVRRGVGGVARAAQAARAAWTCVNNCTGVQGVGLRGERGFTDGKSEKRGWNDGGIAGWLAEYEKAERENPKFCF